jgi:hypothetical protein
VNDLPRCLEQPSTGTQWTLTRAWPRDAGHALVELESPDGRWTAGQWFADRSVLRRVAADTPRPAEAVPNAGVLLQPGGADRRLRSLSRLLATRRAELIVHRPERRAVLRTGDGAAPTYLKLVRRSRAAALITAASRAAPVARSAFTIPAVLRAELAHGAVEWAALPGRALLQLGADESVAPDQLAGAWRRTGCAIAALGRGGTEGLPLRDAATEAETTSRWLRRAAALGLLPPVDVTQVLAPLRSGRPGPNGLVHGDLHDKQVLIPALGPVGLIDVDTLAAGELALDVANLLTHVELRVAQGLLSAPRAALAREAFLSGLDPDSRTLARIPAYAAAVRLRLAAVYACRPRWAAVSRRLLSELCCV